MVSEDVMGLTDKPTKVARDEELESEDDDSDEVPKDIDEKL